MEKCLPALHAKPPVTERPRFSRQPGMKLLLVSRNMTWHRAVRGALRDLGGDVQTCDARDALYRLAGPTSYYSHLLVDRNDAEGLLDELVDLTAETNAPDTGVLLLGPGESWHPFIRVVPAPTSQSITDALMTNSPPRDRSGMNLTELTAAMQNRMIETRY